MSLFRMIAILLLTATLMLACQQTAPQNQNDKTSNMAEDSTVGFSVKNMDLTADPRKDFSRYATGGWLDRTQIPDDQSKVRAANALLDQLSKDLLEIAQKAAATTGAEKTGPVQEVGDFYTAAMDTKKIDELGMKPIDLLLASIAEASTPKQFAEISARLSLDYARSPFFGTQVAPDSKKNNEYALYVGADVASRGFGLNRNEYVEEGSQKIRDNYKALTSSLLQQAGDPAEKADKLATDALAFEKDAAESTMTPVQMANPNATYNKMSYAELKALVPAFDFDSYFAALKVTPPASFIVADPGALKSVQKTLSSHSAEDLRSYFRTYVIRRSAPFLGGKFFEINHEYERVKAGLPKMPPREKDTTDAMSFLMAHPFSRLYVKEHFKPEQRKAVEDMMERIRAEFRKRIEANDWLADSTKKTALEKLDKIRVMVGYPEKDSDWIDYSSVKIAPDDYFGNIKRLTEFGLRQDFDKLGKPVEVDQFTTPGKTTPIAMNAAVHQQFLVVFVTAAFLHPPYYVPSNDIAANFGSLGAVVGHELTHAFDSKGRNYDPTGNLRVWWTPEDVQRFKERSDKLVKQYSAYEVAPGVKVNGELTLSENIADLGGMTLAYNALQTYMKENGRLPDKDGLTPEQRFFVAWAQAWMTKSRPEALKVQVATDPHAPAEVRSFGPAANMDAFYEAFVIKEGDPMWRKPEDRVTIW